MPVGAVTKYALRVWLSASIAAHELHLALYKNNKTPTPTDSPDATDFTECDFPGYARKILDEWDPLDDDDGQAWSDHDEEVFMPTANDAQAVYGYFIWDQTETVLVGGVKFDSPLSVVEDIPLVILVRLRFKDPSIS
jgi:hypothetical protein